ncbi:MAG TPA: PLP-dependent transferase, partial [Gallionellaceae bacterium]|nr:PLP-dependent transferase [Gallionellaceae bacterium]
MKTGAGLSTRCVHAGEIEDANGSPHTPIYTTTTFKFTSTEDLLDVVEGRKAGNLYTRYGSNPTIRSLENKLAALEGAETALAFSSGMAAESALFFAHGRKGIVCIGDAYGGT